MTVYLFSMTCTVDLGFNLVLAMGSPARPGPKKPVQARPDCAIGPGSGLNFLPDGRAGPGSGLRKTEI